MGYGRSSSLLLRREKPKVRARLVFLRNQQLLHLIYTAEPRCCSKTFPHVVHLPLLNRGIVPNGCPRSCSVLRVVRVRTSQHAFTRPLFGNATSPADFCPAIVLARASSIIASPKICAKPGPQTRPSSTELCGGSLERPAACVHSKAITLQFY